MIVMIGKAPLPVSVNKAYQTDFNTGRRVLTEEARDYKDELTQRLDMQIDIAYCNRAAIAAIKMASRDFKASRSKAAQAKRKYLEIDYLYVLSSERRDIDNGNKIFQDALATWLEVNDNWVSALSIKRHVNRSAEPHIEFVLREIIPAWTSGSLIAQAMEEVCYS